MPSTISSAASDEFHQKAEITNSTIFDNFAANFNNGNGMPTELQQLLLRSCAMNGTANAGFGTNANLGSANSLLAYAQQFAAVATVAQQFVAAASAASTAHASGAKPTSNASTPRKQSGKKTSPKAEVTPQKREKSQKVSAAKQQKFFGAIKHEPNAATEAEQKNLFVPSTTVNDFWASLTTSTTTICGSPGNTKTIDAHAFELSDASTSAPSDHNTENAPELPSNVPYASDESGASDATLPRECEMAERKRPAAIQELLQMKRARLNNYTSATTGPVNNNCATSDSPPRFSPVMTASETNGIKMELADESDFCKDGGENDAQTSPNSTANNGNGLFSSQWCKDQAHQQQQQVPQLLLSEAAVEESLSDPASRAVVDLLATLNANGAGMQYLKAIQNCPVSRLSGASSPSTKNSSTPLKSSPNRLPARANDNDVCESALSSLVPHDCVFAQVPGRLSLLSNVVKYKMSVGEVKRRLMGPESFNFSLLGALLRRAKMPEKSQMLVDELNQVGLSIPRGRRRLSQVTLLSALTESESVQFAKDFQRVAEAEFPAAPLAELSARRALAQCANTNLAAAVENRVDQLSATLNLAREFVQLLDEDRSPVMDSNPEPVFERNIQDPLSTFSMLTHGFGTPAIRVGIKMLITFLASQQQFLRDQQQPQHHQQQHHQGPF